jgi:hypothetical protein
MFLSKLKGLGDNPMSTAEPVNIIANIAVEIMLKI